MTHQRRDLLKFLTALPLAAAAGLPGAALATSGGGGTPAGLYQFKIGEMTVTALLDGHLTVAPELISGLQPELAQQALAAGGYPVDLAAMQIPINGYLVQQEGETVLIDAGAAATMGPGAGGLLAALKAAGVTPDQVDKVLLTHLHLDHVAGLIDAAGQPVFANAEIVVAETEWGFWHDDAILAAVPTEQRGFFDIARRSVAPYADRAIRFDGEGEVARNIQAVPLPGHTPGHSGFLLGTGDDSLLIWGDLLHSTALQFRHPDWTVVFDADPEQTVATRRRFLDRAAADQLLVAGMHLDFPGLGRVQRHGDSYGFQVPPWQALL